jgi:hypothetical protein
VELESKLTKSRARKDTVVNESGPGQGPEGILSQQFRAGAVINDRLGLRKPCQRVWALPLSHSSKLVLTVAHFVTGEIAEEFTTPGAGLGLLEQLSACERRSF